MTSPLAAGAAVALVTLVAIFGPLVGISPWWIAGGVGAALAGLSIDAASLSGRGGHLLAEALPGGEARLRRIAVHEAGHALVAATEAMPVRRVLIGSLACLRAGVPAGGITEFDPPDHAKLSLEQLRSWSRVLQAGMAAEQVVYGASLGGADDRALLGRLWGLSGYDADTAQRELRRARREMERQLRLQQPLLETEAEALVRAAPRLGRAQLAAG